MPAVSSVLIGGAIAGGAVSAIGQAEAGREAAAAQGRAARAQLGQAERERQDAEIRRREDIALRRESRDAALAALEPSPEQIAQLNRAVELNEADIEQKQRLLDSADPALIEAGSQALQLLRGEEAATLSPLRRRRAEQREALVNRLRSQLGAGFETSTAGIQALNDFDAETDGVLVGAQDQAIGRLLGVTQNTRNIANIGANISTAASLSELFGAPGRQQAQVIAQTPITSGQTIPSIANFAGAGEVQAISNAQNQGRLFANLGQTITSGATLAGIFGAQGPTGSPGTQVTAGAPQAFTSGSIGNIA